MLTQGKSTIVDVDDYDELVKHNWYAGIYPNNCYRAIRHSKISGKQTMVSMPRVIMKAKVGEVVDHINRNTLDNRKENLRICQISQNLRNRTRQKNNTSGYKGVSIDKKVKDKPYKVNIAIEQKQIFLGNFKTAKEAAYIYDQAALQLHEEFAYTNLI